MKAINEQEIRKEKLLFGFEPFVKVAIEVSQLPLERQIAFFASCCERLLPIYSLASGQPGWGDISILRAVVNKVWKMAEGVSFSTEEINNLYNEVDSIYIEHEDDEEGMYTVRDDSLYTREAHGIARFVYLILEYVNHLKSRTFTNLFVTLIDILYDYVDCYIDGELPHERSTEKHRQLALEHQLTQLELQKELTDLDFLNSTSELTPNLLSTFRNNACPHGITILGSLEDIQAAYA
jgi:uncharacterized protein